MKTDALSRPPPFHSFITSNSRILTFVPRPEEMCSGFWVYCWLFPETPPEGGVQEASEPGAFDMKEQQL